jgi:hypothetical protein
MVSDLGICPTQPDGIYIKPTNVRWAILGTSNGTEETALSTQMPLENGKYFLKSDFVR